MQTLPIIIYPQKILRKKAKKILNIPKNIDLLILQMKETMNKADGIGLAAPQVNISQRIIIVDNIQDREEKHRQKTTYALINPKIVKKTRKQETEDEGCLSLPGLYIPIKRVKEIEVTAQTPDGKNVYFKAQGLAARILQHEIDHINGKLIIDQISPFKRLKLRHELKKISTYSKSVSSN